MQKVNIRYTDRRPRLCLFRSFRSGLRFRRCLRPSSPPAETRCTGRTDIYEELALLQANMAVSDYMTITGNFQAGTDDLDSYDQSQILNTVAEAMRTRLNAAEYARIRTEMGQDPQLTGQPRLGDLIMAVLNQQQTMVSLVREDMAANGEFDPTLVDRDIQEGMTRITDMMKSRMDGYQPGESPVDGATLYADNCAMCHFNLADSNKKARTAAQIQAAIDNNIGNMGYLSTLTAEEILASPTHCRRQPNRDPLPRRTEPLSMTAVAAVVTPSWPTPTSRAGPPRISRQPSPAIPAIWAI